MNKKFLSVVLFGALLASSTGTFTSCKDYDDDINGLQEQIDANKKTLDEKSAALQTALEKANADITAAKAAAAAAQTAADQAKATGDKALLDAAAAAQAAAAAKVAAAQAEANAIAKAQALVNELKLVVDKKVDQSAYDEKMGLIDGELNVIDGKLEGLVEADIAINEQIDALNIFKADITALNLTVAFPELQGKVDDLVQDLNDLSGRVAANELDIKDLKETLGTLSEQVNTIEGNLNTLTALLSSRLTALTFAPSEFINGIEVINFATLEYKPWTNLLADATDGSTTVSINDGKTTAVYYANPSSVKKANIKGLSVLLQDATNTTRAASEINIEANLAEGEIQNGKMMVNLKKLSEGSLNQPGSANVEKFTLLALRANIELTQDEIAKGIAPTVVSDWARLAETAVVPFIHNTAYATTDPADDLNNAVIPHFYPYSKIHDVAAGAVCTTAGQFIVASKSYKEALDLKKMVDVCDKDGHRYVAANYNLRFEFNLVDYNLKQAGEEKTNQKLFAKITDGVITSQARNGAVNNRDAIGREPLVQVVLKDYTDPANGKVVDVRYLKIKWISEASNTSLGNLGEFTGAFDNTKCNTAYVNAVGEEKMNGVYTLLDISNEEFHNLYALDNQVYASEAEAKAGTPAATTLGTIAEVPASDPTMTQNLKWTLPIADNVITAAEYTAGKAVRKVYGRYIHKIDAAQTCTFELNLELTIAKMALIAGYNESYWNVTPTAANADKTFLVNPALTSDAIYGTANFFDCQIIGSMLDGYSMNTAITAPVDLVSNEDVASFVFDADRLSLLPGTGWAVSANGSTLTKGGVTAASITAAGVIRLSENPLPTVSVHGIPTAAAKLLLGKTVPVKLISSYCNGANGTLNAVHDHFLVKFINPLHMTLGDAPAAFQDLITGGSSVTITGIATIKETFGLKRTVWANGVEATAGLAQWYNVKNVTWDLANAKTSLKKNADGSISITDNPLAGDWSAVSSKYKLTASPSNVNATTLTFENNSGVALQREIKIAVPVFADTKWNAKLDQDYVILTVSPGVVPARR